MNKIKIITALYKLTDAGLQVKAEHIIKCLTHNEYFTNPTPSLAEVKTALQEFASAMAIAQNRSKYDVLIKNNKRKMLLLLLKNLSLYIQLEGSENEMALASSGFSIQKAPEPIGVLAKPKNFKLVPMHPGAIKVSIDKVLGAKMYLYEYRIKGETLWQNLTDTRTTVLFSNLNKVTEYEFRAVALGANPERVYTDVLTSTIL